jgi:hypothetical protein
MTVEAKRSNRPPQATTHKLKFKLIMNYTIYTGCLILPAFAFIANSPSLGKLPLTSNMMDYQCQENMAKGGIYLEIILIRFLSFS